MGFKGKRGKVIRLERRKYSSKARKNRSLVNFVGFQINAVAEHDHSYSIRLETDTLTPLPQTTGPTSNTEKGPPLRCLDPCISGKADHLLHNADTLEFPLASWNIQDKAENENQLLTSFIDGTLSTSHDGKESNCNLTNIGFKNLTNVGLENLSGNSVLLNSRATEAAAHRDASTSSKDLNKVATYQPLLSGSQNKDVDIELTATSLQHSSTEHAQMSNLIASIRPHLPKSWCAMSSAGVIQIIKFFPTKNVLVQYHFSIDLEGKILIFIHTKLLPADHELWKNTLIKSGLGPVCSMNVVSVIRNIFKITRILDSYILCSGEPHYHHLWAKIHGSNRDENICQDKSGMKTLRSVTCSQLIKRSIGVTACKSCTKLSVKLRKIHRNRDNCLSEKSMLLYVSEKCLRCAREKKRLHNCKTLLVQQSQIIDRLTNKIISFMT